MLLLIPGKLFVLNPSWEILILISYLLAFIAPLECGIYADFLWSLSFFCFKNNLFGILCYFYSYLSRSNTSRDGKLGNRTRSCTIIRVDHSASFNTKQFVQAIESAGFVSPKLLRSQLPLDFAYTLYLLLRENGDAWGVNKIAIKNVVRKWFVFSVLTGRYSSSPESKMDRDIRGIMDKGVVPYFSDIQAAELGDAFWNVNLVQMLETSSNTHPSFTVYVAAQVFFNDKSLLSSTPVAHLIDNGDVHHIFPKEYLKKAGVARSLYNQVANYTYLETPVNISIGKAAPNDYFGRAVRQCQDGRIEVGTICDAAELAENLQTNCVPADVVNWSIDDYESKFLPARRKMMAEKIRKYYEAL